MLEKIGQRPGMWIDGDKSLKRIRSFMVGYEVGAATTTRELTDDLRFHEFNDWVAKRLGYASSVPGWCNMILEKAGDDEKAYKMFFELLEEFKGERTSAKKAQS